MLAPDGQLITAHFPNITNISFLISGGFKHVYRITVGGNEEILKVIAIPAMQVQEDVEAFRQESIGRIRREVEVIKICTYPELVKMGSIDLTMITIGNEEYAIYSEENVPGRNLREEIKLGGSPVESEIKLLLLSIVKAIKELSDKGFIHRDIKPENVIKTSQPTRPFVLLDLGIAFALFDTALTVNAGNRFPPATFRYIAPEMLEPRFRDNINYRSDLYSAGLTVFEFAAKVHPIAKDNDDMLQTISRAIKQPPIALKTLRPDLSDDLCSLIDQLLKKTPALRPANLNHLISELGV